MDIKKSKNLLKYFFKYASYNDFFLIDSLIPCKLRNKRISINEYKEYTKRNRFKKNEMKKI